MTDEQVNELSEEMKKLMDTENPWPKSWQIDDAEPGRDLDNFLADWPKYQAYFESFGMPTHRVVTDASGTVRLQGAGRTSLQSAGFEKTKDEVCLG